MVCGEDRKLTNDIFLTRINVAVVLSCGQMREKGDSGSSSQKAVSVSVDLR